MHSALPLQETAPVDDTSTAVLLVDDNESNLLVLESVLDGEDYALVKARTADEALLALMRRDFAAVVLDVQMPDISGLDLARLIKQRKRTRHIPIIFLTAHYREDEHAVLGYDAGAVDYLTKPVNPVVLRSKVNVFVDLFRKTRALEELNTQLEVRNTALQREAEERSRRIRAEAAQAEAEAANAAKDRFLAMLSHELRTPLTPIVYAVALLERDKDFPERMREAIATIQRNVRLEARLIDDLLDLARIRSGKLTLALQPVDAHETLRQAIGICMADLNKRNLRLIEDIKATETGLQADPARLQQVFWNLLANAVKFTPEGGTISIRTTNTGSDQLVVEISDTGIGVETEKLGSIFDAFEQSGRTPSSGLGLGLAICKALVEAHGGRVEARSEGSEKGSSFMVTLPVSKVSPAAEPGETDDTQPMALRVLLVDDHSDTASTLGEILGLAGYEVRTGSSVANALDVANGFEFDLLISDISLPDGRGTDLVARLRERPRHPFGAIAMSGFGMEADIANSHAAGFAEHLVKPVELSTLQQAIQRVAGTLSANGT